eukprot:TRINITY_DN13010_c0_g1_i1.p1 TRINITY_DN13010_c0_g1~~TRINITY_DN13010_c0_g1_i1.p1  ORF type:complete len:125 (+),score=27.28 TRINITY_DN13010_c0_g1_i1:152-526(+)
MTKSSDDQLIDAAKDGDTQNVATLLDSGVNINCSNWNGMTSLHWASEKGRDETVRLLLNRGAMVELKDGYGRTPLYYASENGKMECVRLLLDHKADVNSVDEQKDLWAQHYKSYTIDGVQRSRN